MSPAAFNPGFRVSPLDLVVITIGALAIALTWQPAPLVAAIIAIALGHFFVFCNVFRLPRPLELCWAGLFTVLAAATLTVGVPGWPATLAVSVAAAAAFVIADMRRPSYHGLGWRWINPGLRDWWASHAGQFPPRANP